MQLSSQRHTGGPAVDSAGSTTTSNIISLAVIFHHYADGVHAGHRLWCSDCGGRLKMIYFNLTCNSFLGSDTVNVDIYKKINHKSSFCYKEYTISAFIHINACINISVCWLLELGGQQLIADWKSTFSPTGGANRRISVAWGSRQKTVIKSGSVPRFDGCRFLLRINGAVLELLGLMLQLFWREDEEMQIGLFFILQNIMSRSGAEELRKDFSIIFFACFLYLLSVQSFLLIGFI